MPLSDEDLETAQFLIGDRAPGIYEIEGIYGEFYGAIERPKFFGKLFKTAVVDGKLERIELSHIDINTKHWRYKLHGG